MFMTNLTSEDLIYDEAGTSYDSNTPSEVVQVMLWYLDSGCSKHMTGNRSKLMNFVETFIGSVRFGNDHLGAIMGYGDYVMGDSVIDLKYQAKPTKKHFEAIKRVFRYLRGTINMGLGYPKDNAMSLTAYADADHAGVSRFKKKYVEKCSVSWR
ncbi:hypothetical protein Tco_0170399 [Tanacetum coccineum]